MSLLPDAEALLIAALKARPEVVALCGGRVGTRLSGTYPAIRVTTLGGGDAVTDTGTPNVQVECWGNGTDSTAEHQASDMARTVHAAAGGLAGTYAPGRVVGSWTFGLPLHSPDPTTFRERYIVTVGLTMQP